MMLTCDHCDRPTPRGALRDGVCPDCRDMAENAQMRSELHERAQKAEAEVARLNRWITQIHCALAEHAVTNQEPTGVWAMNALERAMRGEAAG